MQPTKIMLKLAIRRWLAKSLLFIVVFGALGACRPSSTPSIREEAPFIASIGSGTWTVPDRPDLYQAIFDNDSTPTITMSVCYRMSDQTVEGCEDLGWPLINQYGVRTFVRFRNKRYSLVREKPVRSVPPPIPLVPVPKEQIDTDLGSGSEAYELARILHPLADGLLTTENGWPIASCATNLVDTTSCTVGFLIEDAFVEASFSEGRTYTQEDIWWIASALETKLRALRSATVREGTS